MMFFFDFMSFLVDHLKNGFHLLAESFKKHDPLLIVTRVTTLQFVQHMKFLRNEARHAIMQPHAITTSVGDALFYVSD